MPASKPSAEVRFRSIENEHIEVIHRQQNGDAREEVSGALEIDFPWTPLSAEQVKAKVDELRKRERQALFAVHTKRDEFVGLGIFGANWDPWCPYVSVLIWPEFRRKGYGTAAAKLLLQKCFGDSIAHVVHCWVPEWNKAGLAFASSLGFRRQGAERRAGVRDGAFYDGVLLDMLRGEYTRRWRRKGRGR